VKRFIRIAGVVAPAVLAAGISLAASADKLELTGDISEGGLVIGTTEPGAKVALDGRPIRLTPAGKFVFGFNRDAEKTATLDVTFPDGMTDHRVLDVARTKYKIQRINGLPEKFVSPNKKQLERIARENGQIVKAREQDMDGAWFAEKFIWPAKGPISGVFGSQRILNGEPRAPHTGLDIAVPVGTELRAPAGGVVSLAQPGFYLTGGTLMIDHGHGLSSVFIHLSEIDVKVGQVVKQGQKLGLTGATGRVTGPHVHWGLYWFDNRLDPQRLVPKTVQ
jgi:murein DD-endopeptidase MepM/ murein hydrolase activator NlpD